MIIEKELYISSVATDQSYCQGESYIKLDGLGKETVILRSSLNIDCIGKLAGKKVKITIEKIE